MTTTPTREQEPKEPKTAGPADWETAMAEYGIRDSWLLELGHSMVADLAVIDARVKAFATERQSQELDVPVVDQETVDKLVGDIVDDEAVRKVRFLGDCFRDFGRPAKL